MAELPKIDREQIREQLKKAVSGAIYSEAATITKAEIRKELMEITRDQRAQVIKGLLGVENRFGEVQLYRTNGHVTELQLWIQNELGDELRAFVTQAARDAWEADKAGLKADIKTAVYKHVSERIKSAYNYRSVINDEVNSHIRGTAKEILAELAAEMTPRHEGADEA